MADKMTDEFNSTEINVEEVIRKAEKYEDREFIYPFEADDYKVPYISFPKMFEVDDIDLNSYATNVESRSQNRQGAYSQHYFKSKGDRNDVDKREQLASNEEHKESEKLRPICEEIKDIFSHAPEQKNEVGNEIDEAMQGIPFQCRREKVNEDERRDIDEAVHDEVVQEEVVLNVVNRHLKDIKFRHFEEIYSLVKRIAGDLTEEAQNWREREEARTEMDRVEQEFETIE